MLPIAEPNVPAFSVNDCGCSLLAVVGHDMFMPAIIAHRRDVSSSSLAAFNVVIGAAKRTVAKNNPPNLYCI